MKNFSKYCAILAVCSLIVACETWRERDKGPRSVAVINAEQAEECVGLGFVEVRMLAKVGDAKRSDEVNQRNAIRVAQQNAVLEFRGNAIAPVSQITEYGTQVYNVYSCP